MKLDLRTYAIGAVAFTVVAFLGMLLLHGDDRPNAIWTDTALAIACWVGTALLGRRAMTAAPGSRGRWGLLAAGLGAEAVAETVWWVYEVGLHVEVPFPGLADLFYLGGYFILAAAIIAVAPKHASWLPRGQAILDGMFLTATLVLVSWVTVVHAVVADAEGGTWLETAVYVSYPALDVLLAGIALTFIARTPPQGTWFMGLLGLGILVWVVGDSAYLLLDINGVYGGGHPTDITWVVGYLTIGATAFLALPENTMALRWRPARWQRAVPWVFLLGAMGVASRELVIRPGVGAGFMVTVAVIILAAAARQSLAVHEVERLQVQTQHEAQTARAYVENARDMVLVLGPGGRAVEYANPATAAELGVEMERLRSEGILAFAHPDDVAAMQHAFQEAAARPGRAVDVEARLLPIDGAQRIVAFTAVDWHDDPLVGGILVNARDVTEERRRQREAVQRESQDHLDEERRRLINGAAHVINTPLTPAMLQLDALRSGRAGPVNERQAKALSSLGRNLDRLKELSQDIVNAFHVQARSDTESLRFDVRPVLEECIARSGLSVRLGAGGHEVWAQGDPALTRDAFTAMLRHLRGYDTEVAIDVSMSGHGVKVMVAEPQEGLPEEVAHAYLEPFKEGLDREGGLSLYICRIALEKQGGSMRWERGRWELRLPPSSSSPAA